VFKIAVNILQNMQICVKRCYRYYSNRLSDDLTYLLIICEMINCGKILAIFE